jgi:hypothetical protein
VSVSTLQPRVRHVAPSAQTESPGWLVGPWFDLLLIANVAWPLALLAMLGEGFGGHSGLQFWQLYYVTTPHRWITLGLVFLDRERLAERKTAFLALAVGIAAACAMVRLTTGALTCLLAIDYVWNAWHFASQHHGIYRIYARGGDPSGPAALWLEKWSLRGFLLYVILRVVSVTWTATAWDDVLAAADWIAAAVPIGLIVASLRRCGAAGWLPRGAYLTSMSLLYLSMLAAVHLRRPALVLVLATASALFHATEYLALVSWSVRKRHASLGSRMGLLGHFAPRWGLALAIFILVLGAGGWLFDTRFVEAWLLVNVVVAFLHYAYDGLIWRRPAPSPATN